jgi:hypothetical protein
LLQQALLSRVPEIVEGADSFHGGRALRAADRRRDDEIVDLDALGGENGVDVKTAIATTPRLVLFGMALLQICG